MEHEWNYSNPTGFFNLSLPHIELKTNMYTSMSYMQCQRAIHDSEVKAKKMEAIYKKRLERE